MQVAPAASVAASALCDVSSQPIQCQAHTSLDGAQRKVEMGSDLRVRELPVNRERDDFSLSVGKLDERAQRVAGLIVCHDLLGDGADGWHILKAVIAGTAHRMRLIAPGDVDRAVARQGQHPGGDGAAVVVVGARAPDRDERLLDSVLCAAVVAAAGPRDAVDAIAVALIEDVERGDAAGLDRAAIT
jgi:hypothetical protein